MTLSMRRIACRPSSLRPWAMGWEVAKEQVYLEI
jgi:hypothetical protein